MATSGVNTSGTAIPVVFEATTVGTAEVLATDASGVPTGNFGIGGQVTIVPGQAPANTGTTTQTDVSASADSFVGVTTAGVAGAFFYQTGDVYNIGVGAVVTAAAFKAALSAGDTVTVLNYVQAGTAGTHITTYTITTDVVAAPTNVVAALVDPGLTGWGPGLSCV